MKLISRYIFIAFCFCALLAACDSGNSKDGVDTSLIHNPGKTMTAEDSARMPILVFDTLEHSFGDMNEGDEVTYEFKFTNKGKGNLLLTEVSASCGCTTPDYPKHIIKPGESNAVTVKYDSKGRPGTFRKGVTVTSNTYPNTTKLIITGNVIPKT